VLLAARHVAPGSTRRWASPAALAPGLALAAAIAVLATAVARLVPVIGAPVIGIAVGVVLSGRVRRWQRCQAGIAFTAKTVLQLAVVLLGTQLSLHEVGSVGAHSFPVMFGTLAVCLILAFLVGRWLGIETDTRTLIGVGTGICGASAIAAVSPVIRAKSPAVAYAISTIFLFNIAAVLTFPLLGHLFGLDQHAFGLFCGTAVNDTSSVVAAASSYGTQAGNYAVVVKLTRTLMIVPICLGLAALVRRRDRRLDGDNAQTPPRRWTRAAKLVPWFLIGFLLAAGVRSAGLILAASQSALQDTALFLITMALAAIGLSTDFAHIRRAGHRPLLLGLVLWIAVATTSLLLQAIPV
jgi:uncharacterized integral membrane protein (TIGR00698 family)